MRIAPQQIKNILVFRNDRFGEFLLNIPAFNALKENFPNSKLTCVVSPHAYELAEYVKSANEVIKWGTKKHSLSEILILSKQLKAKKFDICVIFNPTIESNILAFLAGIPIRIGYDRKWGFLLSHKIKDDKFLGKRHEVEYNLELVGLVGAKTEDKSLSLNIDSGIIDSVFKELRLPQNEKILVALHPWTSDPIKQWPQENFLALAKKITEELRITVLIIGGNDEEQESLKLFKGASDKIINLAGKTSLKQLAAVLKKCKLLISGDSGPVHLACSVGTKVLAIFRNDIPGKTPKRWGPWGKDNFVIEKYNLCDITVNEVFAKAKEALTNK